MKSVVRVFRPFDVRLGVICCACVWVLLVMAPSAYATPLTYYVSNSGSDSYTGLCQTVSGSCGPWQTLAHVSAQTFQPGDTILLKKGDVWNEALSLHGNGATSANWITVDSYGTATDKPKIQYPSTSDWVVTIETTDGGVKNGGWKIKDLDIGHAKEGIMWLDKTSTSGTGVDGLWIENDDIHDIAGYAYHENAYASWSSCIYAGYSPTNRFTNLTIENSTLRNCGVGIRAVMVDGFFVDGVMQTNDDAFGSSWFGMETTGVSSGTIQNSSFLHNGSEAPITGTVAFEFDADTIDVTLQDCELAYTVSPGATIDGEGVDFEGDDHNVTVQRCQIHDNENSAFALNHSVAYCTYTYILNNNAYSNGSDSGMPAFLRDGDTSGSNGGTISGNTITNLYSGQSTNSLAGTGNTNSFPSGFTVSGNTVSDPTEVQDSVTGTGTNQFDYCNAGGSSCNTTNHWTHDTGTPDSGGNYSWDNTTNDYVTIPFTGVNIKVYCRKEVDNGIIGAKIDSGTEQTFDGYSGSAGQYNQLCWDSGTLSAGSHTLTLRITGTKNASSTNYYLELDRVVVVTSASTEVQDSVTGTGTNQFDYCNAGGSSCNTTNHWTHDTGTPDSGGNYSWDNTTNDYVTISFSGTNIKVYCRKESVNGITGAKIDSGTEQTFDGYAGGTSQFNQMCWDSGTLSAGSHTLTLRITGTKNASSTNTYFDLDRVVIT